MDAHELRERQRPLKQAYRDDPASAVTPAHAVATIDLSDLSARVVSWRGETVAGPHAAAGGSGQLACSADMLLESVVACAGVTLASVATAMSVEVRSATVRAQGHWDARGTLGVDREAPVGLTDIALSFGIDSDADDATIARLVELTERYCVIVQTLARPPRVAVSYTVTAAG